MIIILPKRTIAQNTDYKKPERSMIAINNKKVYHQTNRLTNTHCLAGNERYDELSASYDSPKRIDIQGNAADITLL